jgi:hypothetical protein
MPKLRLILDKDPFHPEFKKAIAFKDYRTIFFEKALLLPRQDEKMIEIKKIFHFSLRITDKMLKGYVDYFTTKKIYPDQIPKMKKVLAGKAKSGKIDLAKEIPNFLRNFLNCSCLAVYDTAQLQYRTHIDYYEEGEYVPMAGRGELVYVLDGIEISRSLTWIS